MTPDEYAMRLKDEFRYKWHELDKADIAVVIREAVAEEREACAKNVEAMGPNEFEWAAAIIRQRGCYIPMRGDQPSEYILWKCPKCGYERKLISLVPGCSCDRDGCLTRMERKLT